MSIAGEEAPPHPSDDQAPGKVLVRYARAVDTRDWNLLEDCFSASAVVAGTQSSGEIAPYLAGLRASLEPFSSTMHLLGNQSVAYSGAGEADVETYAVAYHVARDARTEAPTLTVGVVYADKMIVERGRWRIIQRTVTRRWLQGTLPT